MNSYRLRSPHHPEREVLEIDSEQELLKIFSSAGILLGTLSWGALIEFILNVPHSPPTQQLRRTTRTPLSIKVQYHGRTYREAQGMTGEIGTGGLFIETSSPYPINTDVAVTFTLPTQPERPIAATGRVSWNRKRTDRLIRRPGMGIEFIEIAEPIRRALLQLIKRTSGKP